LRGIPVSELLLVLRSGQLEDVERINALGIEPKRLAENLVSASLRQVFRYQFFHADLHPGNLIALPDNVIGFVDFGLCGELDETVRTRQISYLSAVYSGDIDRMFKALTEILIPSDQTDLNAFRRDFITETKTLARSARESEQNHAGTYADNDWSPIARYMMELMRVVNRNRLQVPTEILSMYRALLTAEMVARRLGAKEGLGTVGRQFFDKLQLEDALHSLKGENIQSILVSLLALLRDSPSQFRQILSELSEGRFTLNAHVSETPKAMRARNRCARLITTAILSVGIALLLTIPELPKPFGVSLVWPLWGALIFLYIWLFVQWRQLG